MGSASLKFLPELRQLS